MGTHIVNGQFQSDKYPTCPPGKVPLSVNDESAQDLLWEYAQRRRCIDAEFSDDLETALLEKGYNPIVSAALWVLSIKRITAAIESFRPELSGPDFGMAPEYQRAAARGQSDFIDSILVAVRGAIKATS